MKNLLRRFAARSLVVLCFLPAVSFGQVPLGFGLALVTGVTTSSMILPILASTIIIGAVVNWFTLGGTSGGAQSTAPIVAQLNPKAPLPTPSGWTAPTFPAIQPAPPSTMAPYQQSEVTTCAGSALTGWYDTAAAAAAAYVPPSGRYNDGVDTGTRCGSTGLRARVCSTTTGCASVDTLSFPFGQRDACVNGFTLSGSVCNLTNAAIVVKPVDGTCQIIRTGNTYAMDTYDADCQAGLPARIGTITAGVNQVTDSGGVSADGKYSAAVVVLNSDGTSTIAKVQDNGDGTSTKTVVQGSAPDATTGQVTVIGVAASVQAGSGSATASPSAATPGPLVFPTDYNKEGTQAAIKAGQCGGTGQPGCVLDEGGPTVDSSLAAAGTALDTAATAHVAGIASSTAVTSSGLDLALDIPAVPACTDISGEVGGGHTLTVPMCANNAAIKSVLSFLMAIFTMIYLFNLGMKVFERSN